MTKIFQVYSYEFFDFVVNKELKHEKDLIIRKNTLHDNLKDTKN